MKKIGIGFLFLICLYMALSMIGRASAYQEIKAGGNLTGVIEAYCLDCDTNEEFYALVYEEGSIEGIDEEDTLLVAVNIKNENTPTSFHQDERIYVEFDEYKISLNGKEIIIEKPTVINTVISEEKENQ